MPRKKFSILREKAKPASVTFKIDATLKDQMDHLEQRVAKEAPELEIDFAALVEGALAAAVKKANRELDTAHS